MVCLASKAHHGGIRLAKEASDGGAAAASVPAAQVQVDNRQIANARV